MTKFEESLKEGNLIVADCPSDKMSYGKIVAGVIKEVDGDNILLRSGSKTVKDAVKHVYVGNERIENPNYNPEALKLLG
jgi:hypothetical protein